MVGYSLIVLALITTGLALALLHWALNADGMLWVQVRSACFGGPSWRAGAGPVRLAPPAALGSSGTTPPGRRCRRCEYTPTRLPSSHAAEAAHPTRAVAHMAGQVQGLAQALDLPPNPLSHRPPACPAAAAPPDAGVLLCVHPPARQAGATERVLRRAHIDVCIQRLCPAAGAR